MSPLKCVRSLASKAASFGPDLEKTEWKSQLLVKDKIEWGQKFILGAYPYDKSDSKYAT